MQHFNPTQPEYTSPVTTQGSRFLNHASASSSYATPTSTHCSGTSESRHVHPAPNRPIFPTIPNMPPPNSLQPPLIRNALSLRPLDQSLQHPEVIFLPPPSSPHPPTPVATVVPVAIADPPPMDAAQSFTDAEIDELPDPRDIDLDDADAVQRVVNMNPHHDSTDGADTNISAAGGGAGEVVPFVSNLPSAAEGEPLIEKVTKPGRYYCSESVIWVANAWLRETTNAIRGANTKSVDF